MNKKEKNKAKKTIVIGLLILSLISRVFNYLGKDFPNLDVLVPSAIVLTIIFLISQRIGDFVLKIWFKIAEILGWINSRILLTIIFYFILYPTALLQRIFSKKDNLYLKNTQLKTTFIDRRHTYNKKDLKYGW